MQPPLPPLHLYPPQLKILKVFFPKFLQKRSVPEFFSGGFLFFSFLFSGIGDDNLEIREKDKKGGRKGALHIQISNPAIPNPGLKKKTYETFKLSNFIYL